jgi:hypothetical protein
MIEQNSNQSTTVDVIRRGWNFLLNQENRAALTLIGTFVAAVLVGLWTVYINRFSHPEQLTVLEAPAPKQTFMPSAVVQRVPSQESHGPHIALIIAEFTLRKTAPNEMLSEIKGALEIYVKIQELNQATGEYDDLMAKHILKLALDPTPEANMRIKKIKEKAADWIVKRRATID